MSKGTSKFVDGLIAFRFDETELALSRPQGDRAPVTTPFSGPEFETISMKEAVAQMDAEWEAELNRLGLTADPKKIDQGFVLHTDVFPSEGEQS